MNFVGNAVLILAAVSLTVVRWFIPTVGHTWPMVFITWGVMLTLLWQRRGRWLLGWVCLGVPTVLEAVMFFTAG